MKKSILITSMLVSAFTSCNIDDKVEDVINNTIPPIEQEVSEDFSIPALVEGEQTIDPITIDTTEVQNQINANDNVTIDSVTIDDLEIAITTEDVTFDFLNSIEVVVLNKDGEDEILASFDDIPEGATSLMLPDGTDIEGLKSLLEGGNFELGFNLDVKENITEPIELELISNFLVELDFNV